MNLKELGQKRMDVIMKLLECKDLCKLLAYDSSNALKKDEVQDPTTLINSKILITPFVKDIATTTGTTIRILFGRVSPNGVNFKDIPLRFLICTHVDSWILDDDTLRPEVIVNKIEELFNYKNGFGIGKVLFDSCTPFQTNDKIYGYDLVYKVTEFN